jgi:predicted permease
VLQNLRDAARALSRTPGFALTALVTLALCIGANLTIFAVVDSVLLRPLAFPEPERLVTVFNTYPKAGVERDGASITNYYERRGHIDAFSSLAIYREGTVVVGEAGSTEREPILEVSPDFFSTLGVSPILGRAFTEEETSLQTDDAVILTDPYWREHFGADPGAVGRDVRVDGVRKRIVGVLPPAFRFLSSKALLYLPLSSSAQQRTPEERHSGSSTNMIARLGPGVSLTQAQGAIDAHDAAIASSYPRARMIAESGFRSVVVGLRSDHVARIRPTLLMMQAGVLILLLIGGVNLVNLLLIRASSRTKEVAVRQSLGAGRRHVISQALTETTLLTLSGGVLGLAVSEGGIRLLSAMGSSQLPLGAQIDLGGRVALFALVGAVLAGLGLGLPVAAFNLRAHVVEALHSESRGGTSNPAAERLRQGFIVAQIALAFVLLTCAGLLGTSLANLMARSPGFRPEGVLSGQIYLPAKNYPDWPARIAFVERLTGEMGRLPGVSAAGVVTNLPLSGHDIKSAITPEGYVPRPGESVRGHYSYGVAGDYFKALGIPVREGRALDSSDLRRAENVCVVDEDFARRYWPQGNALGRRLFAGPREGSDSDAFTVVGVVGAVKQAELAETQALGAVYFPYRDRFDQSLFAVARTSLPAETLGATLQGIVRGLDPDLPLTDLRTLEGRVADSLSVRRSSALLLGLFASVALLLTAVGTYGVLSYGVSQRRREIGIRIALGAAPAQVGGRILSVGGRLFLAGVVLGLGGSWMVGRAMQTILFEVPAFHLATLAGSGVILCLVALLACLIPARRAARVDPMEALRGD